MEKTTMLIVVTWLLSVGATFFFTYIWFVLPTNKKLLQLSKDTTKLQDDIQTTKKVASDLRTEFVNKMELLDSTNVALKKAGEDHKAETSKLFETVTEAFEFVNTERVAMIKDLAELKRRVRMNSNEAKRQTYQRRHRENSGTV